MFQRDCNWSQSDCITRNIVSLMTAVMCCSAPWWLREEQQRDEREHIIKLKTEANVNDPT